MHATLAIHPSKKSLALTGPVAGMANARLGSVAEWRCERPCLLLLSGLARSSALRNPARAQGRGIVAGLNRTLLGKAGFAGIDPPQHEESWRSSFQYRH